MSFLFSLFVFFFNLYATAIFNTSNEMLTNENSGAATQQQRMKSNTGSVKYGRMVFSNISVFNWKRIDEITELLPLFRKRNIADSWNRRTTPLCYPCPRCTTLLKSSTLPRKIHRALPLGVAPGRPTPSTFTSATSISTNRLEQRAIYTIFVVVARVKRLSLKQFLHNRWLKKTPICQQNKWEKNTK